MIRSAGKLGSLCAVLLLCWGGYMASWPGSAKGNTATSIYAAGVIDAPTALDQVETHVVHGTLGLIDLSEPDLSLTNLRWGIQLGNFQLLTDLHLQVDPEDFFYYGQLRGKLHVLAIDEISTDIAVGLLGRFAASGEKKIRFADKDASLFAILTTQLNLIGVDRPLLLNVYLDNLYLSTGLELPVYESIAIIAEGDYLLSKNETLQRGAAKLGVELQGEQNFYFQLYYSDHYQHFLAQIGSSF